MVLFQSQAAYAMHTLRTCTKIIPRYTALTPFPLTYPNSLICSTNILYTSPNFAGLSLCFNGSEKLNIVDNSLNNKENKPLQPPSSKLQSTYNTLHTHLPNFFVEAHPFHIYHDDMVFENNIKGTVLRGKTKYISWIYWLRFTVPFLYGKYKLNILKMTLNPDTKTIQVRWQFQGVSNINTFFGFLKKKKINVIKDGFSTFFMDSNGIITKHLMDKMMPDDELVRNPNNLKDKIMTSAKIALILGLLFPDDRWNDLPTSLD